MMDELGVGDFMKANVTICNWAQSRFNDGGKCDKSIITRELNEYEQQISSQDESLSVIRSTGGFNLNVRENKRRSASGGIRGPSGSVRGFADFVRQSTRYLHDLSELAANDQLIYVNSSSLLSKKILEQEEHETSTTSDCPRNRSDARALKVNRLEESRLEKLVEEENEDEHQVASEIKREIALEHDKLVKDQNNNNTNSFNDDNKQIWQRKRQALRGLYLENLIYAERNSCVLYTTSLSVVRRTFDDCKLMRNILSLNLIRFEERDVYLNREYKIQLRLRLMTASTRQEQSDDKSDGPTTSGQLKPLNNHNLPCLFVEGGLFCNLKYLELLNETSQLSVVLARFKMSEYSSDVCKCCGNARFIACQNCNGSRRSMVHHFRLSSVALRCTRCDKNDGLIACPACNFNNTNDNPDSTK